MDSQTARKWRSLSRVLKVAGAVGCVATFGLYMVLISYYSAKRPHTLQPERGWTISISWTHPVSYGTAMEESRLMWMFWSFFPFFGLGWASEAIKIYKPDNNSGFAQSKDSRALKRS